MPKATTSQVTRSQIRATVRSYLDGINNGGGRDVLALFAETATVEDPVGSDVVAASRWYAEPLDPAVRVRPVAPVSVSSDARAAAVAFELRMPWDSRQVSVDVVDVMEFDEHGKITSLRAYWSPQDIPSENSQEHTMSTTTSVSDSSNVPDSPPTALGTWSWGAGSVGGDEVFGNHLDEEQLKEVVAAAFDKGFTLFDTAAVYGEGSSERILGTLLAPYDRDSYQLSTKFTPQLAGPESNAVEAMLQGSLERLRTDHVDIYWIHNPADVEKWTPQLAPLVKDGRVRSVGVSNHNLEEITRAREILAAEGVELAAVQNHYSLIYRASEDAGILDYCQRNGITFYSYMVLEQGALTGRYGADNPLPKGSYRAATYNEILPKLGELTDALVAVGEEHGQDGYSAAEVATAWALGKGTVPIIGATKARYLDSQERAAELSLTGEDVERLERLGKAASVDTRGSWENPMA